MCACLTKNHTVALLKQQDFEKKSSRLSNVICTLFFSAHSSFQTHNQLIAIALSDGSHAKRLQKLTRFQLHSSIPEDTSAHFNIKSYQSCIAELEGGGKTLKGKEAEREAPPPPAPHNKPPPHPHTPTRTPAKFGGEKKEMIKKTERSSARLMQMPACKQVYYLIKPAYIKYN